MTKVAGKRFAYLAQGVFLLATAVATASQEAPQTPVPIPALNQEAAASSAPFTVTANTRYVLVDVIAKDKRGRSIPNLGEKDFTVSEKVGWTRGVAEEIATFQYVDKTSARHRRSGTLVHTPAGVYTNLAATREPDHPLSILLLDSLNTNLFDPTIRGEVLAMIDSSRCDVPLSIMLLDTKLYMLQDFTEDGNVSRSTCTSFILRARLPCCIF